jgi:enoyl-[acyl-carrier-protein] reductase (NADH)
MKPFGVCLIVKVFGLARTNNASKAGRGSDQRDAALMIVLRDSQEIHDEIEVSQDHQGTTIWFQSVDEFLHSLAFATHNALHNSLIDINING